MKKKILLISICILMSLCGCTGTKDSFKIYKEVPDTVACILDVEYGKAGDTSLRMNILRPKDLSIELLPVIIWIHGGSWEAGSKDDFLGELSGFAETGYMCVSVEYRFSDVATFPAQIEDCKTAVRFLRANAEVYQLDPNRIGVWGSSAGGHLAALMGASNGVEALEGSGGYAEYSSDVQAMCNWFGLTDFRDLLLENNNSIARLLGGPPQQNIKQAAAASPNVYISENSAPTLIMVGSQDDAYKILKTAGKAYCNSLEAFGIHAQLKIIRGAGHGFDDISEYRKVKEFFDEQFQ